MNFYFLIQFRRINRTFQDLGFWPPVAYTLLGLVFLGASVLLFFKTAFAPYVYSSGALVLVSPLSGKPRNEFLSLCFGTKQKKVLRIAENGLLALPFSLFMFWKGFLLFGLLLMVLSTLLSLMPAPAAWSFYLPTPFYKQPFEFTVGFRTTWLFIALTYGLAGIAVMVGNFNLGALALLILLLIPATYYLKPEPDYYVWTYQTNARLFLIRKIRTAISQAFLLALPVFLMLSGCFTDRLDVILLVLVAGLAFLTAMLLAKYAAYPGELGLAQALVLGGCLCFPPLVLVAIPYFFRNARIRISGLLP